LETRVYIIFDASKYTKEQVVKELTAEGYKYFFCFGVDHTLLENIKYITLANEVWLWGDCHDQKDYFVAKDRGKDIWQMA
jgi:hypothetical protein